MMLMCYVQSRRSIDPRTKHGAVLVDAEHGLMATGYNGPLAGADDTQVALEPPDKYFDLIHAEENVFLSYTGGRRLPPGTILFVTGHPCYRCFRMAVQKGVSKIVYGWTHTHSLTPEEMKAIARMHKYRKLPVDYLSPAKEETKVEVLTLLRSIYEIVDMPTKEKTNEKP